MNKFLKLKWSKRYLEIAKDVSMWSKDPNKKIGALIVNKNGNIVSQGYNGFPRKIKDDDRYNNKELKNSLVVHAEVNAILNALYNGAKVKNCSIFVHGLPVCHECAKVIIQSGIKNVVFNTPLNTRSTWYTSNILALKMFIESNVKVFYLNINLNKIFKVFIQDEKEIYLK